MGNGEHITHPFEPVFDERSKVLVLGTMPSPRSRQNGFYYGHPQNRFWKTLASLFDEPVPSTNDRKRDFALRHHIALWDVLESCDIEGASDASIAKARGNDLSRVLDLAPIEAVFCTGARSAELYAKLCKQSTGMPAHRLPSTSPANARCKLPELVEAYSALSPYLQPFKPPTLDVLDVVKLEREIARAGTPLSELMDRAGVALAHRAHALDASGRIAVLCGSGNNGGDGWVAACDLARAGHDVTLVSAKAPEEIRSQPAAGAAASSAPLLSGEGAQVALSPDRATLSSIMSGASIIIDAILGTGFDGDSVKEPYATWIGEANRQRDRGALVVSADVPSGLSAQTGQAAEPCIRADATVTMIVPKPGLFAGDGPTRCGNVHVAPLAYIEPLLPLER